jgi:AcrR family transcriptional regulator
MCKRTQDNHMNLTEINIRLAAIKLISRGGYESMSLRQLAAEAGINSSTLYTYYTSKNELLVTLILGYLEELSQAWEHCRPHKDSADVKLQAFIACHVRHHLSHKREAVLGNMELRSLDADELALVRRARRIYLEKLQGILEQGVDEGSLQCDEPKLLSRIIFSMLTHCCAWYQANGRMSIDEIICHYTGLVLKMLGRIPHPFPLNIQQPTHKEVT